MKRFWLPLAALVALAFAGTALAASPPGTDRSADRSAGLAFGSTVPKYEVPAGGRAEGVGTYHVKFYRADGTLYATRDRASADDFDLETSYYNAKGEEFLIVNTMMPPPRKHHPGKRSAKRLNAICGSGAYTDEGTRLLGGALNWYWYPPPPSVIFDSGGSTDTILTAVRNAHSEWNTVDDWCNIADNSALAASYQGVYPTNAGVYDGVNFVAWHTDAYLAPLGCGWQIALACSFRWLGTPPWLAETDYAYNFHWPWGVGPTTGYDVQGIGVHEVGHQIGLNHVSGVQNVMGTGDDQQGGRTNRKLGKGDANADNLWY